MNCNGTRISADAADFSRILNLLLFWFIRVHPFQSGLFRVPLRFVFFRLIPAWTFTALVRDEAGHPQIRCPGS